jgi:hypothetical protein
LNRTLRHAALILSAIAAALGSGCGGRVLDFRNAEIANGKIYTSGANTPFSGKITNIPMSKLPLGKLSPLLQILGNVTGDKGYSEFFFASALAGLLGGGGGGSTACDVSADDGVLDGDVLCAVQGAAVLKVRFKNGALDGDVEIRDPRRNSKLAAEGTMSGGVLNGKTTVYDTEGGKVLHKVRWDNGIPTGTEETWDKAGNLIFKGTLVSGKYDGDAIRYDANGKVVTTSVYKDGVFQKNVRPGMTDLQSCVEDGAVEHRRIFGELAEIPQEMAQAWQARCSEGKRPD